MTLLEKYSYLFNEVSLFDRKTNPIPATVDALKEYSDRLSKYDIPILKAKAKEINRDLFSAQYNLNNQIWQ